MSPIPSDQGSPSFVAPEVPIVSDTLPVVLSIQSIKSHAPSDGAYNYHWNPIWEELKDDIPVWEYTPPSFSAPLSPSDMEGGSPISTDESIATSGEIPTAMEPTPVGSAPTTERLPPGYHALRDVMPSDLPSMSSFWSLLNASTMVLFPPQGRTTSVTSDPTVSVICAVSSAPVVGGPSGPSISRVIDPTANVPHSSGPIPAEGPYDRLLSILQYNPSQPFGGPLSSQPAVEVSVPLSVDWTTTHYHGGQATSAHPPGPPRQDQSSGQSYTGKPGGQQGQPFQGQPSASGGPSFSYYTQPSGNSGQSSVPQSQPGIQQGYPTGQVSQSHVPPHQLNVQYGHPFGQVGYPSVQQSQPTVQYGQALGHVGQPQIQSGQPTIQHNWPSGQSAQPQPQRVHPSGQMGQPQYQPGQLSGQIAQTTGHFPGASQPTQPGFGPQARPQTPSSFQMQGGVQFYQTPPVP